jgi:hypothetical protein
MLLCSQANKIFFPQRHSLHPKHDIDVHESILRCSGSIVGAKCRDIVPRLGNSAQPVPNCPERLFTERYGLALRIVQFEKDLEEPAQVGLEQ